MYARIPQCGNRQFKAPFAFIVQRLAVVVMCSLVTNMAGHLIRVFLLYLYFFLLYLELCYRSWWAWTNIAVDLQVHLFQAGYSCLTVSLACESCVAETDYLVNVIKDGKQRPTQAAQQRCSWGPNQAWPLCECSCVSNCGWCWRVPLTIIRLS